jgi:hypothetical protein
MNLPIFAPGCDKPDCMYYVDMDLNLGDTQPKGTICHRHCVLCTHLYKYDLYTRLVIGKEEDK